jgi:2-iminobutanoate/2-iminopropanoate deaminase
MARRESYEIPNVAHNAPIPMATRVGNILYTSGIMGKSMETGEFPESVEDQARECFKNLAAILAKAGASADDVVKVTVFIKSNNTRQAVNPAWLEMFPDAHSRPARHQTVVETLNFDIQIEAMAVLPTP